MNAEKLMNALDRFRVQLPWVLTGIDDDDAHWKPSERDWSILEIVRHLGDEETDDFRLRLRLTLENPAQPWPRNDPEAWAVERKYNEGRLDDALARFVREREASVQWLRSLLNPDWSMAYQHPKVGPVHTGELLASWAAHDALHLRQIAKRMYQLAQRDAGEYSVRYAGEW